MASLKFPLWFRVAQGGGRASAHQAAAGRFARPFLVREVSGGQQP